mmetsp:Transcript_68689/g.143325  ORF Transcript_68689/g.143325 Transcript_68689/m.143325 type:complete len:235 (-) Transcript_68689:438-1142(-)
MEEGVRIDPTGISPWLILVFIFCPIFVIFVLWVYLESDSDDSPSNRVETWDSRKEGRKAFRQMVSFLKSSPLVSCPKASLPPSCEWAGSYRNDVRKSTKASLRVEKSIGIRTRSHVTFYADGTFKGKGSDKLHEFEILGKFDINTGRFVWLESSSLLGPLDAGLSVQEQMDKRIQQLHGSASEQGRLQCICDAQLDREKGWLLKGRFCSNKGSTGPIESYIMEKVTVAQDTALR